MVPSGFNLSEVLPVVNSEKRNSYPFGVDEPDLGEFDVEAAAIRHNESALDELFAERKDAPLATLNG